MSLPAAALRPLPGHCSQGRATQPWCRGVEAQCLCQRPPSALSQAIVAKVERLSLLSLCQTRRATRPNGEWGYSTRCHMLGRECPEAVLPDRALYLPTFSHLLIVNKLLSLSISLALSVGVLCVGRCACEEDRYFSNCPSPRDDGYRYAAGSHVVSHMPGAQENGHCCSRALLLSQV